MESASRSSIAHDPEKALAHRVLRKGSRDGTRRASGIFRCPAAASDDVAPDVPLETLLHSAVGPDDDGNGASVQARLVHRGLAQLGTSLLVLNAIGVPRLEQLGASLAPANGVDDRNV